MKQKFIHQLTPIFGILTSLLSTSPDVHNRTFKRLHNRWQPASLLACTGMTCVLNDVQAELHLARTHFSNPHHTGPS